MPMTFLKVVMQMFNMFYNYEALTTCDKPPTIYSILNSIVNFDNVEKIKISELAKNGRNTIFDFDYPLSTAILKEDFEVLILNKFMMRRIGFETITSFKIALNAKLNEIMPRYNKMFDSFSSWDLFSDGEEVTRNTKDDSVNNATVSTDTNSTSKTSNESTNIEDLRNSNLPQSNIDNVKNGSYLTTYNYNTTDNTNNIDSSDRSKSTSTSESTNNSNSNEIIKRTPANKVDIFKSFSEYSSIFTMIFEDLENLFYGLE